MMNRFLLLIFLFIPLFTYSQVNEVTFNHQPINFSAAPRSTISPMSIKMWDNYNNGGPSTYGTVLEFYGFGSHQTGQLYFGGWDNSKIRYREAFYGQNTWSEWTTLLDSKNNLESSGSLKISGTGNHYILNGNVGLGTTSPFAKLSVFDSNRGIEFTPYAEGGNGSVLEVIDRSDYSKRMDLNFYIGNNGGNIKFYTSASEKVRITKDGNMGVGTTDPSANLEINGGGSGSVLKVRHQNESHRDWGLVLSQKSDLSGILSCSGYDLRIESGWNKKLYLGNSEYDNHGGQVLIPGGKVGIGTDPGNYKLNVAGRIRADEIVVNTTGADFVFEPGYKLRSLSELETFIRTNKHLPDIAPAKEMQENGVSAGEMQTKLLQKVEELTLYVIEKDKEIAVLKTEKMKQIKKTEEMELMLNELNQRLKKLEIKSN